ncbi:MAG: ExeA family protein [Opitutales bacterium]
MYADFYGFSEMPFNGTPDPRFLFLSPGHQEALAHLRYGIEDRKGFIVLVGEVGCGKTTLCRALLNELDPAVYETALVMNPRINEVQLVLTILREIGEDVDPASVIDPTGELNEALLRRIAAGKEIVLIIDEAQNLSFEVLEQLRLLSNLETDDRKLLQIVLIGQPELKEKLAEKRLRQLRQRIQVYFELKPLKGRGQVNAYIQHRLTLAGGIGRPQFTPRALNTISKRTQGTPRLINTLCDKSLLSAFVRSADVVRSSDVRRGLKEMSKF